MGNQESFGTELSEDCPEFANKFNQSHKEILSNLFELYKKRCVYGLYGGDAFVELRVMQKHIEGLFDVLPKEEFPISTKEEFLESKT